MNIFSTRRFYPDVSEESLRFYHLSLEIIIPRYSRIVDRSLPLLPSLSLLNQPPAPFILEFGGRTV